MSLTIAAAVASTPARNVLARAACGAVVLERIALGGGRTRWFHVTGHREFDALVALLHHGSIVSFYFDQRIRRVRSGPELDKFALETIRSTGEVCLGMMSADGITIDMDFVGGPNDYADATSLLGDDSVVYVGPFPARDNDGSRAITLTLPDADGIVRAHPH